MDSGPLFSRGLSDEELVGLRDRLSAKHYRYRERVPGLRPEPSDGPPVLDPVQAAWADFLGRYDLDTFFTCTFSDAYAAKHYVYAHVSALNNFQRWLKEMDYSGQYFVAAEDHCNRDVPHLHGLMQSQGLPLKNLWAEWFRERGRAKFEEPRSDASTVYCTKYALKDKAAQSIRFVLGPESFVRPRRRR